jgi:hypothetical protein
MYNGTLIDKLLGVVESAEKSSRDSSAPETQRNNKDSKPDVPAEAENHSPNSSRNRLV